MTLKMKKNNLKIWTDANLYTMTHPREHQVIHPGALVTKGGNLLWVGEAAKIPKEYLDKATEMHSLNHACVTPGLIDCHTHTVFAGNRINEFKLKIQGIDYASIQEQGGGILSTVKETRKATEETLYKIAEKRVKYFIQQGVTGLEIKSGYGLDIAAEQKCLRVARALGKRLPVSVTTTFLGAHVLPPEFKKNTEYIYYLSDEVLPKLVEEGLVDSVDAFCETIAFRENELIPLFDKAKKFNLNIKIHAEQLSLTDGVILATTYQALSVDHLEYLNKAGVEALKNTKTVAVLLPGAYYYLRSRKTPPIDWLREANIPMAVATDFNPGTSPCCSLLSALNLACVLFRLTPFEALKGVTKNAAKALGWEKTKGQLQSGYEADFVAWDVEHPDELAYLLGHNPCLKVIKGGEIVYEKPETTFSRH